MKKDITHLFCFVDDFAKDLESTLSAYQICNNKTFRKPTRQPELSIGEIMTIILLFPDSPCRNFKFFYQSYLQMHKDEFPRIPTYERFVALMPRVLPMLVILLYSLFAPNTGINFIDATGLAVCHPKRISRNKVFKGLAALGKTTKGWFFGFKLHIIINENGALRRIKITPGNVDDRKVVNQMTKNMTGLLFGDKGYISKELFLNLYRRGLKFVTGIKKNMQKNLMLLHEKTLLRKRSIVETVFDYLKNKFQIEHNRHRSPQNMLIHVISTLIVYQLKPSKPSIRYYLPS
jgi:hypothetical protein